MKRYVCVVLCGLVMAAGCGSRRESSETAKAGGEKAGGEKSGGIVTVSGMEFPVYPDAKLHQDLKISVAYIIDAEPAEVRAWYDKSMAAAGWRSMADWIDFGGQYQKNFLSGEALGNSKFAEKMVKLGVAKHKKGGTHFMIMPIVSKYKLRKP